MPAFSVCLESFAFVARDVSALREPFEAIARFVYVSSSGCKRISYGMPDSFKAHSYKRDLILHTVRFYHL